MSDAPKNQFLFEFGIDENRTHELTRRVTQIVAKNIKITDEPGSDVLRCDLDKGACVRDIVRVIECSDLSIVESQWLFFAFGTTIGNDDRLCEIAREEYVSRRLFAPLKTTITQEE
jgi:hypothetical protein